MRAWYIPVLSDEVGAKGSWNGRATLSAGDVRCFRDTLSVTYIRKGRAGPGDDPDPLRGKMGDDEKHADRDAGHLRLVTAEPAGTD